MIDIEHEADLKTYLVTHGHFSPDEPLTCQVLAGGVSNKTVWVQRANGEAWVLKQALPKLRVKADWFSDPMRIQKEALGLRWLATLTPVGTIPALGFQDDAHHILAMAAVPQPHTNWKTQLLSGEILPNHIVQFGQILGQIHRGSAERHKELAPIFEDRQFFESLRLEPYYQYTAQQQPDSAPFYAALISETRQQLLTIVHGDYSPKNILVHQEKLILLDHEVIHFGDPAFDVGFSLTHLLSKAHHLRHKRAAFLQAADLYWQTYLETLGAVVWRDTLEPRAVRHTVACLLARVDGRSPLEYLTETERQTQRAATLRLMHTLPTTIPDLIQMFDKEILLNAHP
jgi:fructosamine-3-kinase